MSIATALLNARIAAAKRIPELVALGYYVQNMGDTHGPEFEGQYRWMHRHSDDFQDWGTSDTIGEAWADCDRHVNSLAQITHS